MFSPFIAALIVQGLIYRQPLALLGFSLKTNVWFLVALLLPMLVSVGAFGFALLMPGVRYSPDFGGMLARPWSLLTADQMALLLEELDTSPIHPFWLLVFDAVVYACTINTVLACGEEVGWRGLMQNELGGLGFWGSCLAIGAIWGVWHTPIILLGQNYPGHPYLGVFMMVVWCILLTPMHAYVRLRSGSVIAAAVAHGAVNASPLLAIALIDGGNEVTVGASGLAGFAALLVVNAGILVHDRLIAAKRVDELITQ